MRRVTMTKYEILYGYPIGHFPNEKENVVEKLRLVKEKIGKFHTSNLPHTYENQCVLHELTQAEAWARKILKDIEE